MVAVVIKAMTVWRVIMPILSNSISGQVAVTVVGIVASDAVDIVCCRVIA